MSYELPGLQIPKMLGRLAEFSGLVRDLVEKATPDHISMVAPRYFGKSVVLHALAEHFSKPDSHYRVVINWDLRHDTPEDDRGFQVALMEKLDKALLAINNSSYHDYLRDPDIEPSETISDVVDSLAAEGMKILILLDDFDRLACQPQVSKNLWDYLRGLAQKNHLRFVLSSRRRLRECIPSRDGRTSDFWNIFTNVVTLKPFSTGDIDLFLAPLVEAGVAMDAAGKSELAAWTGGIPVLAACLCRDLLTSSSQGRISRGEIEALGERLVDTEGIRDILGQLWDDCSKELQGDLIDIGADVHSVDSIPEPRRRLLADRGYIAREGSGYRARCRLMQRFAAGHELRSRDLRDLFKDADTELRSLKTLLALRLSAIENKHPDTRSYIEHAIEGLARGPKTALASIRSIAEEALTVAWEAECPGNVVPSLMQQQLTKSWDVGGGGLDPGIFQKLSDKNTRRRILRIASGDQGRAKVTKQVSRPMMLLIDHLHNVGNYGQHINDVPASQEVPVDVSFCAAACWNAIELFKRMSEDLADN